MDEKSARDSDLPDFNPSCAIYLLSNLEQDTVVSEPQLLFKMGIKIIPSGENLGGKSYVMLNTYKVLSTVPGP